MARLNKRVKLYIVRSLATYETPSETARGFQEEFGIEVTKQQCEAYDLTKKTGQDLSEEFKTEFYRVRKEMNDNLSSIPIANIAYRLKRLQHPIVYIFVNKVVHQPILCIVVTSIAVIITANISYRVYEKPFTKLGKKVTSQGVKSIQNFT